MIITSANSIFRIVGEIDDDIVEIIDNTINLIPSCLEDAIGRSGATIDFIDAPNVSCHPCYSECYIVGTSGHHVSCYNGICPNIIDDYYRPGVVCTAKGYDIKYNTLHEFAHTCDYSIYHINSGNENELKNEWEALMKGPLKHEYYNDDKEYFAHSFALGMANENELMDECGIDVYNFITKLLLMENVDVTVNMREYSGYAESWIMTMPFTVLKPTERRYHESISY